MTFKQQIGGILAFLGVEALLFLGNFKLIEEQGFWRGMLIANLSIGTIIVILFIIVMGINLLVGDK